MFQKTGKGDANVIDVKGNERPDEEAPREGCCGRCKKHRDGDRSNEDEDDEG